MEDQNLMINKKDNSELVDIENIYNDINQKTVSTELSWLHFQKFIKILKCEKEYVVGKEKFLL